LLLALELVGTEESETALSLSIVETVVGGLEQLEDIVNDDSLEVDLLLVVQVLSFEFNLYLDVSG
jgi:hypothetical protein